MNDILRQIGEFAETEQLTRERVEDLARTIENAALGAMETLVRAGAARMPKRGAQIGCKLGDATLEVWLNPNWISREGHDPDFEDEVGASAKAAAAAVEMHRKASEQAPYRADVVVRLDTRPVYVESLIVTGNDWSDYESAVIVANHGSIERIANDRELGAGDAAGVWATQAVRERQGDEEPDSGVSIGAHALAERWGTQLLVVAKAHG